MRKCDYGAIVISDHSPLTLKFEVPVTQSVYRPWRLNPLLLSNEDFVKMLSSEIKFFIEVNRTPGMPLNTVWESLKAYLRGQIISYCANKKKEKPGTAKTANR